MAKRSKSDLAVLEAAPWAVFVPVGARALREDYERIARKKEEGEPLTRREKRIDAARKVAAQLKRKR